MNSATKYFVFTLSLCFVHLTLRKVMHLGLYGEVKKRREREGGGGERERGK